MQARITRVRDVPLPEYKTGEAAAFDLCVAENAVIAPGETVHLPTGLIIQAPAGHFLLIAPRSSTFKKKGLRLGNTIGVIDRDFCGPGDELMLVVWNPGKESINVEAGERIAQGLFVPVTRIEWDEGEPLGPTRGGLGSTGGYSA